MGNLSTEEKIQILDKLKRAIAPCSEWDPDDLELERKTEQFIEELQKDLERSKDFEAFWQHAAEETLKKFQVAISNKPRWISVTEQLPEENGHYLVYAVGNGYCSTYIALWNGRFRANFEMPITHWMSLPQPPKSEGE